VTFLEADYFDGQTARAQRARVRLDGPALLIEFGGGSMRRVALADVQWPERQRHGARVAHIALGAGGGSLHGDGDAAAWDAFVRTLPLRDASGGWVVRAQQSWRGTLAALALLVAVGAAGYVWGVPLAARGVLAATPVSVDAAVGRVAIGSIEGAWLKPTELAAEDRARLADAFARMVAAAHPDAASRPAVDLRFHASRIGPNAFALPGGTIVVTDELVKLMAGRDDIVLGVLAHEVGHVRARHGMRMLVQISLIGAAAGAALGDFSSVLAGVPALLGQLGYSRDAEREADAYSVTMINAAGISPRVMVEFFERLRAWREGPEGKRRGSAPDLGIAFSSHPADAERMAYFESAAR
jgi:Zn-dependent protease with chaperone function